MNKWDAFTTGLQHQLYLLVRAFETCDRMCVAELGVTVSQCYTLLALPEEGNVSMDELSKAMGLANSTMTRTVDHLVRKGLVYRAPDDEDRRIVRVGSTAQGGQVRRALEQAQQDFIRQALAGIQESERSAILYALERVAQSLAKVAKVCGDN